MQIFPKFVCVISGKLVNFFSHKFQIMMKIPFTRRKFLRVLQLVIVSCFMSSIVAVLVCRFIPLNSSSYILQKKISNLFSNKGGEIEQTWVSLEEISPYMQLAVIASEDQRFPEHFGIDFESIEKAVKDNKRRRNIRGASTITQQVARNLFLWSGKSYIRKGLEVYFTFLIEVFWSKERILEVYLNVAEFGDNIYGVESASRKYFNKSALQLTINESALLAACLPNPKRYKAYAPSPYVVRRSGWIRRQMSQLGGISYLEKL